MISSSADSARVFIIQNSLAALVFGLLLTSELLAYLLYRYPSAEILWALTIPFNRIAGPMLSSIDFGFGKGPLASMAVLAAGVSLPLLAWRHRNWLGTAIAGHVALAICVVLTFGAVRRATTGSMSASLSPIIDPASMDANAVSLAIVSIVLVALCFLNHVAFFRRTLRR